MKAVLLAAGEGTRLRPLTLTTPKCLVPINGRPLLDYWLEMLVPYPEIEQIFINVCYLKELVIKHIRDNWGTCKKIILWEERALLGTAGTIKTNIDSLIDNDVMVIHADNLSCFNLNSFITRYKTRDSDIQMTMMLFETDRPSSCGIVELDKLGRVLDMHEKVRSPPGNLANGAVYIFSKEVISWINKNNINDISKEVIPHFIGKINSWKNEGYHRDIGEISSLQLAMAEFTCSTKLDPTKSDTST